MENKNNEQKTKEIDNKLEKYFETKKYKTRILLTSEEKRIRANKWSLDNYYKNKAKLNAWQKEYHKRMYHSNIQFKKKNDIRARLNQAIRLGGWPSNMDDLFGCTFPEFIRHIISKLKDGMEFNNRKDWHIDHIVPVSNFDLTDAEQVKQAYHYTNLEPIWAKENRTKARKHRVIPSN